MKQTSGKCQMGCDQGENVIYGLSGRTEQLQAGQEHEIWSLRGHPQLTCDVGQVAPPCWPFPLVLRNSSTQFLGFLQQSKGNISNGENLAQCSYADGAQQMLICCQFSEP